MAMAKAMTIEEMEKDAKAAEEAAKAESAVSDVDVSETKPVETSTEKQTQTDAPAATPKESNTDEMDSVKKELAEKQARIDELTKRVRDEDGKRGGELSSLRDQVDNLGNQLKDLMAENRTLRQKPEVVVPDVPAEPDPLEAEYPDVAKAIGKRTKPIQEAAARAEEAAKLSQAQVAELREARFFDTVIAAVPELEKYNADSEFLAWCGEVPVADDETRQQKLNRYRASGNSRKAIELLGQWNETKTKRSSVVVEPVVEPVVKKEKPSKEAQVNVPSSSASPASPQRDSGKAKNRIAQLETKIFKLGTATKEDREELESLYIEAEKNGELR
jgi:DNA repair exonuclease SbcCD ATPase subunit